MCHRAILHGSAADEQARRDFPGSMTKKDFAPVQVHRVSYLHRKLLAGSGVFRYSPVRHFCSPAVPRRQGALFSPSLLPTAIARMGVATRQFFSLYRPITMIYQHKYPYQPSASRHLIEQPIEATCSAGPCPVSATWHIASNRSRRTSAGSACLPLASSLPRYCSCRSLL